MDFEADFDSYLRDTRGSTVTSLAHLAAWNRANSSRVFTTGSYSFPKIYL